jgi:3-oxoacyl-[acyl-carrier protein] reductase
VAVTLVWGSAVVTGASRGIGAAVARALGRAGAGVVVNYHSRAEQAEAVAAEIREAGGRAIAVQADVTSGDDIARLAETAHRELGEIAIVVSNASVQNERATFLELGWADYQRQIDATLKAFLFVAQAFLPEMIERGQGRLIGIGSTQTLSPNPGSHAYVTAKAGLTGMLRVLAKEVGEHGVTANLVTPGFTLTDRVHRLSEEFRQAYADRTPMRRIGVPEDVAAAVSYFASEEAQYVTGTDLLVDGGHALG